MYVNVYTKLTLTKSLTFIQTEICNSNIFPLGLLNVVNFVKIELMSPMPSSNHFMSPNV